jgi:tetratricopeptide (TPR) repeat protein
MRIIILVLLSCLFIACGSAARPTAENSNAPASNIPANERPQTAIAHTTEGGNPPAASGEKSKWSQGGDAIDTSTYDAEIVSAEKGLTAKPTDTAAKKAVGDAYYKRADALTQARQYAAALGDYRRAAKADPTNTDAKKWIDQIMIIYQSMNKEAPPEGQEPPPLPFKKG